jgi:hypothetical protein
MKQQGFLFFILFILSILFDSVFPNLNHYPGVRRLLVLRIRI